MNSGQDYCTNFDFWQTYELWIAFAVDEWLRGLLMLLRWGTQTWESKAMVKPQHVLTT
ncbi:hypothetical protein [Paenibacillus sp. N3.4]|uniref:hypothetical protein n=1 Tax=Paenibacillus sp. N3.4 TaxID=2603222 RepID=UPI00164F6B60|nr:hypothetical protein [Paenibacillus sp. N3.4]